MGLAVSWDFLHWVHCLVLRYLFICLWQVTAMHNQTYTTMAIEYVDKTVNTERDIRSQMVTQFNLTGLIGAPLTFGGPNPEVAALWVTSLAFKFSLDHMNNSRWKTYLFVCTSSFMYLFQSQPTRKYPYIHIFYKIYPNNMTVWIKVGKIWIPQWSKHQFVEGCNFHLTVSNCY